MGRFQKVMLALSCFLPLFLIFIVKNSCVVWSKYKATGNIDLSSFDFVMSVLWLICILLSVAAIAKFKKTFLEYKEKSKKKIELVGAENVTAEYFFTYFSLFVLTFFTVDPSSKSDVGILLALIVLMLIVYIKNGMFFINPILNILGYKSFSIKYVNFGLESAAREDNAVEIKVFSKEDLAANIGENFFVSYSTHDFSICYKQSSK